MRVSCNLYYEDFSACKKKGGHSAPYPPLGETLAIHSSLGNFNTAKLQYLVTFKIKFSTMTTYIWRTSPSLGRCRDHLTQANSRKDKKLKWLLLQLQTEVLCDGRVTKSFTSTAYSYMLSIRVVKQRESNKTLKSTIFTTWQQRIAPRA